MPYIYTTAFLQSLVQDTPASEVTAGYRNVEKESGPAEFSFWRDMEGLVAWQQKESIGRNVKKKKIIISNALLELNAPPLYLLELIDALIKNYDVYIWPGSRTALADCKPLTDSKEFWRQKKLIVPAAASQVCDALAEQGLNSSDYKIVDYDEYKKWYFRIREENSSEEFIEISPTFLNFRTDEGYSAADQTEVTRVIQSTSSGSDLAIRMDYANYEQLIHEKDGKAFFTPAGKELFSKANRLYLDYDLEKDPTESRIYISRFFPSDLKVEIICINGVFPTNENRPIELVIPDGFSFPEVDLRNLDLRYGIHALGKVEIGSLRLEYVNTTNLNLSNLNIDKIKLIYCKKIETIRYPVSLKHLTIFDNEELVELNISRFKNLTELDLRCEKLRKLTGPNYNLKILHLTNCPNLKEIDLEKFPNLETIVLNFVTIIPVKGMKRFNLEHVKKMIEKPQIDLTENINEDKIYTRETTSIHQYKDIRNLKIKGTDAGRNVELDVALFPNLQTLEIGSLDNIKFIGVNKNIKKIKINSVTKLTELDLSSFPNLEEIELNNTEKLNLIHGECKVRALILVNQVNSNIEIDFRGMPSLENFTCWPVKYDPLIVLANSKYIANKKFGEMNIDTSGLPGTDLSNIQRYTNHLEVTTLDKELKLDPKLKSLKITGHNLEKLDLSEFSDLESLEIDSATLKELILPKKSALKRFEIKNQEYDGPKLRSIDFSTSTELEYVKLKSSGQNDYNFTNCARLKEIHIKYAQHLSTQNCKIDLSGCIELREVSVESTKGIDVTVNVDGCAQLRRAKFDTEGVLLVNGISSCQRLSNIYIVATNAQYHQDILINLSLPIFKGPRTREIYYSLGSAPKIQRSLGGTRAQIELTQRNESSPVSLYQKTNSYRLDAKTGDKTSQNASGNDFKVSFYTQQPLQKNHYLINIFDKITYKNGQIEAVTSDENMEIVAINPGMLTADLLKTSISNVKTDPELVVGFLEANVKDHSFQPIAAKDPLRKGQLDVYADPKDSIEVYYNEAKQQNYFRLRPGVNPGKVKLLYRYQNPPVNFSGLKLAVSKIPLLPPDLLKELDSRLNKPGGTYQFMFDKNISREEKLARLAAKIGSFQSEDLSKTSLGDLDVLCSLLQEDKGKGACRHRALAFMVLAQMLDVPVTYNENEKHAVCQVPYISKNGIVKKLVDLGGTAVLDLTPEKLRTDVFAKAGPPIIPKSTQPHPSPTPDVRPPVSAEQLYYESLFETVLGERNISNIRQLLDQRSEFQPLIKLGYDQDPFVVNKKIIEQLGPLARHHVYIHRPEDFNAFLNPRCYVNGEYEYSTQSPLRELIKNGGVLVVNWANFSAAQMIAYASILEKEPTLLGEPVTKNLLVVGLSTDATKSCEAFISRSQPCKLQNEFFETKKTTSVNPGPAMKPIDLYQSTAWRELLLGKQVAEGNRMRLQEGPLIEAIRKGKSITILNPPNDPHFNLLMHRLDEGKLLYNGELLPIPESFKVNLANVSHPKEADNVSVSKSLPTDVTKRPIYIGLHNIHECYEQLRIEDEKGMPGKGLLDLYDPQSVFIVSGFIPANEWERLIAHIKEHYPHKKFEFHLAAESEIEQVASNTDKPKVVSTKTIDPAIQVFTSNDPDLLTLELSKQLNEPMIIDTTPQMEFSSLIYEQRQSKPDANGHVKFTHIEKDVLKALQAGRDVILNGEISPTLYQQLLPYLDPNASVYSNGEKISKSGKLYMVIPPQARTNMTLLADTLRDYKVEDYLNKFDAKDKSAVLAISRFYNLVTLIPHKGLGMPELTPLSFQQINIMLTAMKSTNPLHTHNPVKAVFNYQFPKYSKAYAISNVFAKSVFDLSVKNTLNPYKLRKLKERFDLTKEDNLRTHMWDVLNCYSGPILSEILNLGIETRDGYPVLSEAGFKRLAELVKEPIKSLRSLPAKSVYPQDKQFARLVQLLKDPDSFLIILKGPPGVGKTHTVRELIGECYEGEGDIEKWLVKGGTIIFDEANMAKPRTWDFLKGLSRDKKVVYYKGKSYDLTNNHKVILTGNPEEYEQRYHHQLFREYANTIYYTKPGRDYLEERILYGILPKYLDNQQSIARDMIKAYDLIQKYNPFHVTSIRDLENLALRFTIALEMKGEKLRKRNDIIQQVLLQSCIYEFSGNISDPNLRTQFIKKLEETLNIKYVQQPTEPLIYVTPKHALPGDKACMVESIEQLLIIRSRVMDGVLYPANMKKQIIIEGESGVGKTTLFKAMIERRIAEEAKIIGLDAANLRWQYDEINASTKNVREKIIDAFYNGKIIILNEINLDPTLERLLNHLLDGKDRYLEPHEKRPLPAKMITDSFRVYASQNPGGHYADRMATTQPTQSRSSYYYMNLSKNDYTTLAAGAKVSHHVKFALAYEAIQKRYPAANARTFFSVLNSESERQSFRK